MAARHLPLRVPQGLPVPVVERSNSKWVVFGAMPTRRHSSAEPNYGAATPFAIAVGHVLGAETHASDSLLRVLGTRQCDFVVKLYNELPCMQCAKANMSNHQIEVLDALHYDMSSHCRTDSRRCLWHGLRGSNNLPTAGGRASWKGFLRI